MDLLKSAGKFIGWLSGSLAAVTGILYAFGYLATLSNLHSLGLDSIILSFDPQFYLQRGSSFALYVIRSMFKTAFYLLILATPVILLGLLIYRTWVRNLFSNKDNKMIAFLEKRRSAWNTIAFGALVFVLILHMWPTYDNLTKTLSISDLLFPSVASSSVSGDAEISVIRNSLTKRDETSKKILGTKFYFAQMFLLEASLAFYLAWRVVSRWKFRLLLVAPFALVFGMFFISMPMIYGVIVLSNEFSTIWIAGDETNPTSGRDYYLLNKTNQEFIVWDGDSKRIVWLPVKTVSRAEIGRRKPLPFEANTDQEEER